jgi:hypothetical protein
MECDKGYVMLFACAVVRSGSLTVRDERQDMGEQWLNGGFGGTLAFSLASGVTKLEGNRCGRPVGVGSSGSLRRLRDFLCLGGSPLGQLDCS